MELPGAAPAPASSARLYHPDTRCGELGRPGEPVGPRRQLGFARQRQPLFSTPQPAMMLDVPGSPAGPAAPRHGSGDEYRPAKKAEAAARVDARQPSSRSGSPPSPPADAEQILAAGGEAAQVHGLVRGPNEKG